ncbi:hypothetical protein IYW40_07200 [Methylocystis sp. H4A]|uniref:hypothetical protein n=1 Tax=Methylocystis sp. H4A TaxID=2785788 RepID=UPI0018C2C5AF|nr:hypothetical protein [Methylocystis sp. H4A]MBG0801268.1 hypothetical protein [Methylocystis sp. H4A]
MAAPKWRGPPLRDAGGDPRNCHKLASRDGSYITKSQAKGQEFPKSLRARIYDFIRENPGARFSDLERIRGVKGTETLAFGEKVILWSGLSAAAIDAIIDMLEAKIIDARGPALAQYLRLPNGARAGVVSVPSLPVLFEQTQPPQPHWFPAILFVRDDWVGRADRSRAS